MAEGYRVNSSEYHFILVCRLQLRNFAFTIMLDPNVFEKLDLDFQNVQKLFLKPRELRWVLRI